MNVLLKDKETGRFYAGQGEWVGAPEQARVFADLKMAAETWRTERLFNAMIVVHEPCVDSRQEKPVERLIW